MEFFRITNNSDNIENNHFEELLDTEEFFENRPVRRATSKTKARKQAKKKSTNPTQNWQKPGNVELRKISPLNKKQEWAFTAYNAGQNLMLSGVPGSGKSLCALYLALNTVLNSEEEGYKKVIIIRSAQSSKQIGFLPGNDKQKMEVYESPYISICSELFGRGDAYSILKRKGLIQFISTSYLRGMTFKNAIVILEEYQNLQGNELYLVLSRLGDNTKLIMNGDIRQTDLKYEDERSGFKHFINIIANMDSVTTIEFGIEEIVRSGFVKSLITETLNYMDKHKINLL